MFLTEARIPAGRILGSVGDGWTVARTTLAAERANTAGRGANGLHPARSGEPIGDLDLPVSQIIERARAARVRRSPITSGAIPARMMIDLARQHGRSDDPVVRQELARYYAQTRVNSWTLRRSAAARGAMTGADGSLAKLATSRICQQSRDVSFQIIGAAATLWGDDHSAVTWRASVSPARATASAAGPTKSNSTWRGSGGSGCPAGPASEASAAAQTAGRRSR